MKKKTKISTLKKKLWKEFATYIKIRDNYTCITCGKENTGCGMHAGHFIPKRLCKEELYFNENNVHAQCFHCNINCGGFGAMYFRVLQKKYDEELPKILINIFEDNRHLPPKKWTEEDYLEKIEHYKNEIKRMAKKS